MPDRSRTEEFLGFAPGDVVSFVGGGGKSTLIHSIARRLAKEGRKVITTATRKWALSPGDSPYLFLTDERPFGELMPNLTEHGTVAVAPERLADGGLRAYSPEEVDTFADVADYLLVEAEDARGESLPPIPDEPRPIPPLTTVLCTVAGLDALGPHLDTLGFATRLTARGGPLTCWPKARSHVLLLNKADRNPIRRDGAKVAEHVRKQLAGTGVRPKLILTSVKDYLKAI